MSDYDSRIREIYVKKIIQDLTDSFIKIEVTNENVDEFYQLESILKANEDELRLKKQLISNKIRNFYTNKYLDQHKIIFEDSMPYPLIYAPPQKKA